MPAGCAAAARGTRAAGRRPMHGRRARRQPAAAESRMGQSRSVMRWAAEPAGAAHTAQHSCDSSVCCAAVAGAGARRFIAAVRLYVFEYSRNTAVHVLVLPVPVRVRSVLTVVRVPSIRIR